jgi:hypothetical protein
MPLELIDERNNELLLEKGIRIAGIAVLVCRSFYEATAGKVVRGRACQKLVMSSW